MAPRSKLTKVFGGLGAFFKKPPGKSASLYVVIFRATLRQRDGDYTATANTLRELALRDFGCLDFTACCENEQEIALSYWPDRALITAWKAQADHIMAQRLGRTRWYSSYHVQVARVERDYHSPMAAP